MSDSPKSNDFVLKVVILALLVFAIYSNAQLLMKNYQLGQILRDKKESVTKQELNNLKLKNLIAYYQTGSFQEVEARRRLALQREDEKVFTVKLASPNEKNTGAVSDDLYEDIQPTAPVAKTNIQLWWEYLFK